MTSGGSTHEVVVVGARCAGAATAMLLARQGHDVVVVDRAAFPSDTLSTHALSRGGVVQLARWGLLDTVLDSGAPKVRTASFHFPDGGVLAREIKDRAGVDFLLAPRRHVLDMLLVEAALAAGARFESRVDIAGTVTDDTGRVTGITATDGREFRGTFVVGADGLHSRVARSVEARTLDDRGARGGANYAYVADLDADGFEFHLAEGAFAGVFPTHGGEANVWVCTRAGRRGALLELLDEAAPSLAARVRRGRVTTPTRGVPRLPNYVRQAAGPGWALVGDAGYHRDPITGHGITDAFRDAELLAGTLGRALRGEDTEDDAMREYAAVRDRALAPIFDVTCRLAEFPPIDEFAELQKQLSRLIDLEAAWLAGLGDLPSAEPVAA
jgi:flavin-dependent dehydrogenase